MVEILRLPMAAQDSPPSPDAQYPSPRVFWGKRLQAIENKGRELKKESKEAASD